MFILANIEGSGYIGHNYNNKWLNKDRTVIDWKGDKTSSRNDKYIKNIVSNKYPIHLFTRDMEYETGAELIYRGLMKPLKIVSDKPINIILSSNNLLPKIEEDDIFIPTTVTKQNEMQSNMFKELNVILPKRSDKLRKLIINLNDYKCEIDPTHITFQSRNDHQYMETHHIVPLSMQQFYKKVKLDTKENIACLCPNCHRLIHYGKDNEKIEAVKKIYDHHIIPMNKIGIKILSFEELLLYYN